MRLFLFDIDGTLISGHGVGRIALTQAMQETFGTAGAYERYDFRGMTDPRIVGDLLLGAGISEERIRERLSACFDLYVDHLEALIANGHRVDVMPGVADLVRALASCPDALVGLLTGNIEPGARAKLRPTGLLPFFRVGAYGSDNADRRRLPAVARGRAEDLVGRPFPFERVTIIGDTPLDIDCARSCGAVAVAVATGQHATDELAAFAPDLLFTDFSDVTAAVRILLNPEERQADSRG
ncbi:MAG TPA: HAD family hydrolase [Candidatus Acidoferrum sp.]|nr:HAD family hydrolase [Candidatus Acidoferrum sp.]